MHLAAGSCRRYLTYARTIELRRDVREEASSISPVWLMELHALVGFRSRGDAATRGGQARALTVSAKRFLQCYPTCLVKKTESWLPTRYGVVGTDMPGQARSMSPHAQPPYFYRAVQGQNIPTTSNLCCGISLLVLISSSFLHIHPTSLS